VLVIIFGIRMLIARHGHHLVSRAWAIPAGLAGGALGGAFGTGAATPPMIYLTHRLRDKAQVRGTFSGYAILVYSFRLVVFAVAGLLLDFDLLLMVVVTLPAMALGLYTGNRLHGRISHDQALRVISFLLIVSGTSLVWKALA
ncbi:MAG: TSUP family transporter, partial [Burkholderiales bacterium]|nr:TSUP family transporter [Burkholderiales bacterium]